MARLAHVHPHPAPVTSARPAGTPRRTCQPPTHPQEMKSSAVTTAWAALACTLALAPALALGQSAPTAPAVELKAALQARGDPTRGAAIYDEDCAGCHRANGAGRVNGSIPRLSGQHAPVIVKQLVDIRSGLRNNPPMKPFVDDPALDAQAFADIAAYLQVLPVVGNLGKGPGTDLARGKALYDKDCASCHRPGGEGLPALFAPMLAAQHHGYLLREMGMIRDGTRGNSNPAMMQVIKPYAPADMEAVADYLSRLAPPAR